jgi:hypothetical protein
MARCYNYTVAQLSSDAVRNERLNVAILIFEDDRLSVKLPKSLDKVRAVSGALNTDTLRDSLTNLANIDDYARQQGASTPAERLLVIQELTSLGLSPLGEFTAPSADIFDRTVRNLITQMIEPEPAPARLHRTRPTKLLTDVKTAFRNERVLAQKGEDIDAHRIVTNYKVAEGLPADLILKNGAMHVIQTADASSDESSAKRVISSIAISALVFEQARMGFGDSNTKARLIYKANSMMESLITPSLDAAEHQGAKLINWDSRDDRVKFIVELTSLASPLEISRKNQRLAIHASTQKRFDLN